MSESEMLNLVRVGCRAGHRRLDLPVAANIATARLLRDGGYIAGYEIRKGQLRVQLDDHDHARICKAAA